MCVFVSLVAYFHYTTPNIGVLYIYNNKAVQCTTPPYISFHWNLCDSIHVPGINSLRLEQRINIVLLERQWTGSEAKL